jgi:hypothetical protein
VWFPVSATKAIMLDAEQEKWDSQPRACLDTMIAANVLAANLKNPTGVTLPGAPLPPGPIGFTPEQHDDMYPVACSGANFLNEECSFPDPLMPELHDRSQILASDPTSSRYACGLLETVTKNLMGPGTQYVGTTDANRCGAWDPDDTLGVSLQIWSEQQLRGYPEQVLLDCTDGIDKAEVTFGGFTGVDCIGFNRGGQGLTTIPIKDNDRLLGMVTVSWRKERVPRGVNDTLTTNTTDYQDCVNISKEVLAYVMDNYMGSTSS